MSPNYQLPITNCPSRLCRAFTLMELMVSVSILVIIILSVGVIFQSVSRTVGVSEASMEMLSNVRAIQRQLESDLAGLNKNTFLVIRCSTFTDPTTNVVRRGDQISFISTGSFINRVGTTGSYTDNNTIVPSAFVWWGQLAIEKSSASTTGATPSNPRLFLPTTPGAIPSGTVKVPINQVPTGINDSDFILGRHTTLLVTKMQGTNNVNSNGTNMGAYPNTPATGLLTLAAIDYNNTALVASGSTGEPTYDITQSRIAAAQSSPPQIMSVLMNTFAGNRGNANPNIRYEANDFCYRYATLTTPYDGGGTNAPILDGYYRMHPIALQGVSSFAIDWTDGSLYVNGDVDVISGKIVGPAIGTQVPLTNTTRWFGASNTPGTGLAKGGTYVNMYVDHGLPALSAIDTTNNGDNYTAIFSYDNQNQWPVALRFRYHLADPTGRFPNGRDFVQVIKLQ